MFKYNKEQIKQFTEMNRAAWNDAMPLHQKANKDRWDKKFSDPKYINQDEFELAELNRIGFKDQAIVQFCCNNGVELLSLKRQGAARCAGFDISDEAIIEASDRAKRFNLDAEYYQSDVYEIGREFDNQFDLAYFTVGALGWLPDLAKLWQIVSRLLKPDGKILIYEQHPFALVFAGDDSADPLKIEYPYFSTEPEFDDGNLDYIGKTDGQGKQNVYFVHTMSDMIESLLAAGFNITGLKEYAHDISAGLSGVEDKNLGLPLSYILTAGKDRTKIILRRSSIDDLDFVLNALAAGEGYTGNQPDNMTVNKEERAKISRYLDKQYSFGPNEIDNCPKFTYLAIEEKTHKRVGFIMFTVRDFNTPEFQDFGIFDKIDRSLFPKDGRFCEVFDLWVDSGYRRQGIATQLKLKAEEIADINNLQMIYTHTEADNPHVIELNTKLGYKIIRTGALWDDVIRVSLIKWI